MAEGNKRAQRQPYRGGDGPRALGLSGSWGYEGHDV